MFEKRFSSYALLAIVLLLGYLTYLIFRSFLTPIAWAIVFSIVFYPVYKFTLRFVKLPGLAAAITVFIITAIILGPFSYLTYLLASELSNVSFEGASPQGIARIFDHPYIKPLMGKLLSLLNVSRGQFQQSIVQSTTGIGKKLLTYLPGKLGDIAGATAGFAFMTFALFFLLKDGARVLEKARSYMPFSHEQKERLTRQMQDIIISTIHGGVVVGVVQGIIGSVGFAVVGMQSPILWGLCITIASFIPLVGSFIVWGPAVIYLLFAGHIKAGVILTLIGVLGISMVDNVLRPIIIKGRVQMPFLLIFFSVLGGIQVFGMIGLVMGPLVLALFISVLDIFKSEEEE
jgi:predicted PurR-regulated permease PerM